MLRVLFAQKVLHVWFCIPVLYVEFPIDHVIYYDCDTGTGLYELWKRGLYKNYHPDKLVDLVARILALLPPWVRVYRIQRDIPMPLVTSGVEKGNLRELALARMAHLGLRCR